MKSVRIMAAAVCAAALCGGAFADEAEKAQAAAAPQGWNYAAGEGLSYGGRPIVSAEACIGLDSRYMTYGVVDGKDPIIVPGAKVTFADWVYFGVESIFDVTKGNGKRGGYANRAGRWTTLDATVGLAHEFDLDDDDHKFGFDFNYMYEYLERHHSDMGDTQYLNLELTLGGYFIEPKLWIERDLMADDGTYVNLELAHSFPIVAGENEDDDPVLAFTPSIAQGFGNTQRTRGYFSETTDGFDHGGVMDTCIKGELTWKVCPGVEASAYVAYSDYWFDGNMRDAARDYNAEWGKGCDHSWNFYGGLGLKVAF